MSAETTLLPRGLVFIPPLHSYTTPCPPVVARARDIVSFLHLHRFPKASKMSYASSQAPHTPKLSGTHGPTEQSEEVKPHDVTTILNYFKDNDDDSAAIQRTVDSGAETYASKFEPQKSVIHDIRGNESQYTLDVQGFQIVGHDSKEKCFLDDEHVRNIYYPETEELLKKVTGASKVFIFNHTIRCGPLSKAHRHRGPVHRVHIDVSYVGAHRRVSHYFRDNEARLAALLKGRYQIINVWRPIKNILKDPLCVADAGSVPESDLVPIKLLFPPDVVTAMTTSEPIHSVMGAAANPKHKVDSTDGETFSVRANPGHMWYYLYRQATDEVLLIKCFDSKTDGSVARRAPHTAFVNKEHEDEPERESIELRTLVFYSDDTE
ncbi:hypothetical protein QC763_700810 [Podospora pseudopauciseta]|uniref:Aspirochlorine biosynthesis protein N n=1 Tax=Podospora pseudopauciseta TaxID=2093780 RepID=A0ABR0H5B0_9PEZI|nr:hypothetical protein QC763_700810 [Podospora pseudopauciseta]